MVTNKRRTEVASGNPGVSNNFIDIDFDKGQAVNIHGFRLMIALEPEDADANANGAWAVYVLPGNVIQNSDLPTLFSQFGDEKYAPYLWGFGPWIASNQTPAMVEFAPKSSRNMQSGGRIVLLLRIQGVSAGLVRHNTMMTCFTTPIS